MWGYEPYSIMSKEISRAEYVDRINAAMREQEDWRPEWVVQDVGTGLDWVKHIPSRRQRAAGLCLGKARAIVDSEYKPITSG